MGTSYSIKLFTPSKLNLKQLHDKVENTLKDINQKMSTYVENSELSLFNKDQSKQINVSYDTAFVIQKALEVSAQSDGAFDITIAPIIDLWGFDKTNVKKIPNQNQLKQLLNRIGYKKVSVKFEPQIMLIKKHPEISCNLSAIAKGYAVDKVAELLLNNSIKDFLIEIGGEIRVNGKKGHLNWVLGIQSPKEDGFVQISFPLTNLSLATSGDYRNYFIKNGKRYSHTIDPRTGKPIQHHLASVSVLHKSCMMADAYATAINVLGPDKGKDFAKQFNLPIYMIIREGEVFKEIMNEKFKMILNNTGG